MNYILICFAPLVIDMLLAVLRVCSEEELVDTDTDSDGLPTPADSAADENQRRRQEIKSKIIAVGKMQKVFQMLRCVSSVFHVSLSWTAVLTQPTVQQTRIGEPHGTCGG